MTDGFSDPGRMESNVETQSPGTGPIETRLDPTDDEDGNIPLIGANQTTPNAPVTLGTKTKKKGFGMRSKATTANSSGLVATVPTEASTDSNLSEDALLIQHKAAVQKVLAESSEQAIEAIMQLTAALQARTPPEIAERLWKANKQGGDQKPAPKPQVVGKPNKKGLSREESAENRQNLDRIEEASPDLPYRQRNSKDGKQALLTHIATASHKLGAAADEGEEELEIKTMKPRGVFADADAMKAQLREAMTRPTYDVANFYWEEGCFQTIARNPYFENLTLCVIAFNALWIAVDVDANPADVINDAPPLFVIMDNFFCIYFLFEIIVRFGAFKNKRDCCLDRWFMFDSSMCVLMIFETWVVAMLFAIGSSGSGGGILSDASLLKGFRLIRLIRMARMLRLLNSMPELMVLIKGMKVAFRAVSCTVALLLIIIYVFAVALRQITDNTQTGDRIFTTVADSARFLLIQGTMPDLFDSVDTLWDENWFFALVFLLFILVVSITVMNMLVGVLVGVVNTVSQVEKEQLMVEFVKTNLLELMRALKIDEDGDGFINRHEFDTLIQQPAAIRSFDQMGVDVVGLVDLADFIFKDDHALPFGEFMEVIMQLRGSNQATVKDIVDLRKCVVLEMHQVVLEMHALNEHALKLHGHEEETIKISIPKQKQLAAAKVAKDSNSVGNVGIVGMRRLEEVEYEGNDVDDDFKSGNAERDKDSTDKKKKTGVKAAKKAGTERGSVRTESFSAND